MFFLKIYIYLNEENFVYGICQQKEQFKMIVYEKMQRFLIKEKMYETRQSFDFSFVGYFNVILSEY